MKRIGIIGVLLIIAAVTHHIWIFQNEIFSYSDWTYIYESTMKEQFSQPFLWNSQNGGGVNIFQSFFPLSFVMGGLATLGLSYSIIQKIVFFIPIVFIAPLASFFLVRHITKSDIAAFIGSIVYCYNTYFLHGQTSHLTIIAAYSFVPLTLLFALKVLEKRQIKDTVLVIISLYLVSFYEFRILYLNIGLLLLVGTYYIFINKISSLKNIFQTSFLILFPIISVLALHLYWIFPLSQLNVISDNAIFSRDLFGGIYMSIANSFAMFHPFWTGSKPSIFVKEPIVWYFWFIPFIALTGLYTHRKSKYILLFAIIGFLGIFLSKQENIPFTNIYPLLYAHLPGFNAFREASKFYLFIMLGYSVLIGAFIQWLSNQKVLKNNLIAVYGITFLVAFLFLWNTKSYITGEVRTLFAPREIPQDYLEFKSFVENQEGFFRALWIPSTSRWSYTSQKHPTVSLSDTNWSCTIEDDCFEIVSRQLSDHLLDAYSVKYVVIPLIDSKNEDDFFASYYIPRDEYIKKLDSLPYLKKIDIFDQLVIYENSNYYPHISVINPDNSISNIQYTQIDPTHYVITDKININSTLLLTENYHPAWKIKVGEDYDDGQNKASTIGLNKWIIDQTILQDNSSQIQIVFDAQNDVDNGFLIMYGTFIVGLIFVFIYTKKFNTNEKTI